MNILKLKSILVSLLTIIISFSIVSCSVGDLEQITPDITTVDDDKVNNKRIPSAPVASYDAFYTWIRCASENAPPTGIAELKVHFLTDEQCGCLTERWIYENCINEQGLQSIYNYCDPRSTSSIPWGELCDG